MTRFTIPEQYADTRFAAGGRDYEFSGTELVVEDEADAKRIRTYARENPMWGITDEDAKPAPDTRPHGDVTEDEQPAPTPKPPPRRRLKTE